MTYYVHPQETWDEVKCEKVCNSRTLSAPFKGMVNCDSAAYPSYGQTRRYNGGCVRVDEWFDGETVPLPIIPAGYAFKQIVSWGLQLIRVPE